MTTTNSHTRILAGARPIRSGLGYERLFSKPDYKQETLKKDGTIDQTVHLMGDYIRKYYRDTARLAPLMQGENLKATCQNIWNFVYHHIQYTLDKEGEEQLRRPAYLWATRQRGGDCDCMTIFVCSVLTNLGIPFKIRIVKYYEDKGFQHVYPIVPIDGGNYYYTIDCVVSLFNYEKPFILKKDYPMTTLGIPIVGLHGIPSDTEDLVNSLGAIDNTPEAVYDHLVKTRDIIKANKGIISHLDHEPAFLIMLDYAIAHFWTPNRDEAFKHLAWNEAVHNRQAGITEEEMIRDNDNDDSTLQGVEDLDGVIDGDDLYDFDGLGRTSKRKERKALRKQQKAEKKMLKASQKKNKKKAAKKMRKAAKKMAKGFFRKAGVVLANKAGKEALLQHNPVILAQQESADEEVDDSQDDTVNDNNDSDSDNAAVDTENTEDQDDSQEEAEADSEDQDNADANADDETVAGLLGLGSAPRSTENEIYRHLIATRELLRKNPKLIPPHIDHTAGFLSMLDYAIKHYWTPQRDNAIRVLALNEAKLNRMNGLTEEDLLGGDDEGIDGIVDYDNVYEFNGLGELGDSKKRKQVRAERKAARKAQQAANKNERKHAKGFFRKVGVALKQGAKSFKKFNPALVAMRNSFLLVMKINLFGFASKAKWGYATPEQAKAAGISDAQYQHSKNFVAQLEKIFVDKAGGSKVSLKRNILTSKKAQLKGSLGMLGTPAAAPVVAAIPMIVEVVKLLKENGLLSSKEAADISKKVKDKDIQVSDDDAKQLKSIEKEEDDQDKAAASSGDSDDKGGTSDNSSDGNSSNSDNDPDKKSFLTAVWEACKEHPYLATAGFVVGAFSLTYLFSGRFRRGLSGMLHKGGKQSTPTTQLSGIGKPKLPTKPVKAEPKKLKFITLK